MAPFPCCTGKILARRRSAAPKQGSPYRPRGAKQGWPRKKSAPPKNYYLGDLYRTLRAVFVSLVTYLLTTYVKRGKDTHGTI